VGEIDMDFALIQFELYPAHLPGSFNAQDASI
jgi:hypothetical protein